jgi:hypothetical protein
MRNLLGIPCALGEGQGAHRVEIIGELRSEAVTTASNHAYDT